jgi:hypothetical protein
MWSFFPNRGRRQGFGKIERAVSLFFFFYFFRHSRPDRLRSFSVVLEAFADGLDTESNFLYTYRFYVFDLVCAPQKSFPAFW